MFNEKNNAKMVKFTNFEFGFKFFDKYGQKSTSGKNKVGKKNKLNVKILAFIKNIYKYCCKIFFYML